LKFFILNAGRNQVEKIKLLDDHKQIYVWVKTDDPTQTVSPHFDYRQDAMQWYEKNHQKWDHYSGLPSPDAYV
jgi:hypothetical protein